MVVEFVFSEIAELYGDYGNELYIRKSVPEATFVNTTLVDTPYFAGHTPDLIVMGSPSEKNQERAIAALLPYKDRLRELVDSGTVTLFTGTAGEILFDNIENWDGRQIPALGILPFTAARSRYDRFNGLNVGTLKTDKGDTQIVGFRSQFTFWHGDNTNCPFIDVTRGIGLNRESALEGIRINNLFVTQILGPILVMNPDFTEYLFRLCGSDAKPAFYDTAKSAHDKRLAEFSDPNTKVNDL